MVSGFGGNDFGVIQPPFSTLPVEDESGIFAACPLVGGFADSVPFIIKDIPYQYAVPILSGWDLGYGIPQEGCDDANVKNIGIWIDSWKYGESPDPPGTLRYKLSAYLSDKDTDPAYYFRHRVSVKGIRAVERRVPGGP